MTYAFTPVPQPTLPIKGTDKLFPIHRIYCVGRNYAEHTKEMGGDTKDPPFFFQKNADNVVTDGKFPYPSADQGRAFRDRDGGGAEVGRHQHQGRRRDEARVRLRRRHRHDAARPAGRGQEAAAPVGSRQGVRAFRAVHGAGSGAARRSPAKGAIWLEVNGVRKQTGDLSQMIWDVPHQIEFLSSLFELQGRRPDLHGHALRRRRHQEGRPAQGPRRRRRRPRRDGHLTGPARWHVPSSGKSGGRQAHHKC